MLAAMTLAGAAQHTFRESVRQPLREARVDESEGVIRGVTFLGLTSANDRDYDESAVREAVSQKKYDGVQVFLDHVEEGEDGAVRTVRDLIGVSSNSTFDESAKVVRGDVDVLRSDPQGAKLLEIASRPSFARAVGMSHDAVGRIEEGEDGREKVTDIVKVVSLDAVTRPGTTRGLYESRRRPMKTKQLLEMLKAGQAVKVMSAEGERGKGVISAGPFFEVQVDGEEGPRLIPAALLNDTGMPPAGEEGGGEGGEGGEGGDATTPENKDGKMKKPVDEAARRRVTELEAENATLREAQAKIDTRERVRAKTRRLSESMAKIVEKRFADRTATDDEIDSYIQEMREIVEGYQRDSGQNKEPVVIGLGPPSDDLDGNESDENLIRESFGSMGVQVLKQNRES